MSAAGSSASGKGKLPANKKPKTAPQKSVHECGDCGKLRPESERHLTTQFFCGCGGSAVVIDLTGQNAAQPAGGAAGGVGVPVNLAELPVNWTAADLDELVDVPKGTAEFDAVVKDLSDDILKGFTRMRGSASYHGDYINSGIRKGPLLYEVTGVRRPQFVDKLLHYRIGAAKVDRMFTDGAKSIRVYHGTSKKNAESMAENGFSRFKTTTPGYGHGVYFDPHGQISFHHAIKHMSDGKCYILVCELVYGKIGRTGQGSTEPPDGTDCGACCEPSKQSPVPCILVSFRDCQVIVRYIIEFKWFGAR